MLLRLRRHLATYPQTVRLLLGARLARSIAQGVTAVDFALYLRALGWSGSAIGFLLGAALLFAVTLTVAMSIPSDRLGRKPFLISYDVLYTLACLCAAISANPFLLAPAAVVAGFGRGANGSAGPFSAIEQAWMTQGLSAKEWTRALGLNTTLGFVGMGIGAACGVIPAIMMPASTSPAASFRIIFDIAFLASLASLACLVFAQDHHHRHVEPVNPSLEKSVRKTENTNLRKLSLVNFLQGTGIGLTGPLVSYWFAIRFHIGPGRIAPLMAMGFFLAAGSSLLATLFVRRIGLMNVIVGFRVTALGLLVALPLAPNLPVAMLVYLLHGTLNRATNGPRASITSGLVRNQRRGLAGMVSKVSRQIPRSVGPIVAGHLFDSGMLAAPFLLGAFFQAGYLFLYQRNFRDTVGAVAFKSP